MALEIRDERVGDIQVLGLVGRLDTDTAADLELAVQDLIDAGAKDFLVDLASVGYVSSAGLRVLLMLGKSIDGKGCLRLCGLNPTVRTVFDVAGFTQLFSISANREAALTDVVKVKKVAPPSAPINANADLVSVETANTLAPLVAKLWGLKVFQAGAAKPDPGLIADVARVLGVSPAHV